MLWAFGGTRNEWTAKGPRETPNGSVELRNSGSGEDYRARLYRSYAVSHFANIRDATPRGLAADARRWKHIIRRFFPADPRAEILDLGCGYGSLVHALRLHGYTRVTGVDTSADQVALAQRLAIPNVLRADGLRFLRDHPSSFDVVASFDVFEHLTKDELLDIAAAAHHAVRERGRLIFRVPNADGPFAGRMRYGDLTHDWPSPGRALSSCFGRPDSPVSRCTRPTLSPTVSLAASGW